jgi:hypothetical protein
MEIDDPFENIGDLILRDFYNRGWQDWYGILYDNQNQLELFDTTEYQKWDRFGNTIKEDKNEKTVNTTM